MSITSVLIEAFYNRLDHMLAKGAVLGADVAVCSQFPKLEMRLVAPGGEIPTGREWTIYHTSKATPEAFEIARAFLAAPPRRTPSERVL